MEPRRRFSGIRRETGNLSGAKTSDDLVIDQVRQVLASVRLNQLSEGELLSRYVLTHDDDAFAELVRRLGPTVMGVCQRILGQFPEAEDAFQATFMVLARKAATVRPPSRIAAWLHGVATLAAKKARAARARRLRREQTIDEPIDRSVSPTTTDGDLAAVLDEELRRLPENLRLAIVYCEIREFTIAQTSKELGWPIGTVASRLSRGRKILADRLRRRGAAPALAVAAIADVPRKLVANAVSASLGRGAGSSTAAMSLTSEVVQAMMLSKIKLLCVGLVAAAAIVLPGFQAIRTGEAAPMPKATQAAPVEDPLGRFKYENPSGLLRVEAVQKDLRLSDEQLKKLDDLRQKFAVNRKNGPQIIRGAGQALPVAPGFPGGGAGAMVQIAGPSSVNDAEFAKGAADVCTPEQMRRLKQIGIQATGPEALLDRRVIRTLHLSAEQEDKIDALLPTDHKRGAMIAINVNGVDKIAEKTDQTWAAALDVLTAEQRGKWNGLIGEQLPTAELQKAHAGHDFAAWMPNGARIQFGGGGGGGAGGGVLPPGILPPVPPMPAPRP
jgi:RNA polymerase sigma factor (sigma-70 family)